MGGGGGGGGSSSGGSVSDPLIAAVSGDNRINATERSQGVTISGTQEAGATTAVKINGTTKAVTNNGTSWSVTLTSAELSALTDGNITIEAVSTSASGVVSSAVTRSVNLDTAIPLFQSASASARAGTVTLVFNESLDGAAQPTASQFTVKVGGNAFTPSGVTVSGSTVVLSGFTFGQGVTVEVDYQPNSGVLRDLAGNTVAQAGVTTMIVADGYISGATVYMVKNGVETAIPGAVTDSDGRVFIPKNVDLTGASIIVKGGYNVDTGVPNVAPLKAPVTLDANGKPTTGVINPLTTLVQAVVEQSGGTKTAAQAATSVAQALGISTALGGADLLAFDPIKAAAGGGASATDATNIQKVAAKVATVITLAAQSDSRNAAAASASVACIGRSCWWAGCWLR